MIPDKMQAVVISRPGGPEVLEPTLVPTPAPGPGEVLIRVAAAGVNYPDMLQRSGRYDPPPDASPLPGLEVSGVVAALGDGVATRALGEEVVALTNGGGYAEYVTVPAGQVLPLPRPLSLVAGAALPETFFTVTQTLVMRAGLGPDMSVLVHGAAGGIGGAAVQIALAFGARPIIAVVSTPEKAAYARSLGATDTIGRDEDFVARTVEITDGRGADRIIALAGGPMLARNLDAAARFGVLVQLATLDSQTAELSLRALMSKALTLIGSTLRPQSSAVKAAIAARLEADVWPHFAAGTIAGPKFDTLPLARAADAHRALAERTHFGKLVLVTRFGAGER